MACDPVFADTVSFAATGATTLITKKPEYGNTREFAINVVWHRTRGGKVTMYKQSNSWHTQRLTFVALTRDQKLAFDSFVAQSRAQEIAYIDHVGAVYNGFITSYVVTENGKTNPYNVELIFEEL